MLSQRVNHVPDLVVTQAACPWRPPAFGRNIVTFGHDCCAASCEWRRCPPSCLGCWLNPFSLALFVLSAWSMAPLSIASTAYQKTTPRNFTCCFTKAVAVPAEVSWEVLVDHSKPSNLEILLSPKLKNNDGAPLGCYVCGRSRLARASRLSEEASGLHCCLPGVFSASGSKFVKPTTTRLMSLTSTHSNSSSLKP